MIDMHDGSGFNPAPKFPAFEEIKKILIANLTANASNPEAIEAQRDENQVLAAGGTLDQPNSETAIQIDVAKAASKSV